MSPVFNDAEPGPQLIWTVLIMNINVVEREFVYHGAVLADPDCKLSIEDVRSFYATQFPELTSAAITGPETVGDRLRYSFERAIGSKG
jgi:PRTRC genetic system protein C